MARAREASRSGPRSKAGTLGALQAAFLENLDDAEDLLGESAPDSSHMRSYHVVRASAAMPELRTDVNENTDGLAYLNFSPPPGFGPRYSILRVTFVKPIDQKKFMSHAGEEVLVPMGKGPRYHFYWSRGGGAADIERLEPLHPGSAARINPQLPHHGWLPKGSASPVDAWMLFRHASEVPTSISIAQRLKERSHLLLHPRQFTVDELDPSKHPTRYALVAWGLSESIRLRRLSANLSLAYVAKACSVDRSLLSRIENESTSQKPEKESGSTVNVSLATLFRIADFLHIDVLGHIRGSQWSHRISRELSRENGDARPWFERPILCDDAAATHLLHLRYWDVLPGSSPPIAPKSDASSWIVLSGRAVFDIKVPENGLEENSSVPESAARPPVPEIVDAGSVLHFKARPTLSLQVLEPTRILQVEYSHECPGGADSQSPHRGR